MENLSSFHLQIWKEKIWKELLRQAEREYVLKCPNAKRVRHQILLSKTQ